MTPQERDVIDALADTWNRFCQLPVEHSDECAEFRAGIHALQDKVAARSAWRALARYRSVTPVACEPLNPPNDTGR